ncbi:uncharacterized protein [Misgurnus anguillicaudatus]|uniref:uncharacterized protein n=1 Tax=Misgurnus anguillicaudatus TaxID=75329 RepID=UPI003CCF1E09
MEAAGDRSPSHLEEFLQRAVGRMDRQDKAIDEMGRAFQAMVTKVSELALQAQQQHPSPPIAPPTPPTPPIATGGIPQSEPRLPIPEKYAAPHVHHRGSESGVRALLAHGEGCPLGDGGVGEPRQLLFFVPRPLGGDETGLRPLRRRGEAARLLADLRQEERPSRQTEGENHSHNQSRGSASAARGCGQPTWRSGTHAGGASSALPGGEEQAEIPWTVFILWQSRTSHPALPSKRSSPIVNLRLLSGGISARKTSSTSTLLPVRLRWSTHTLDQHALVDSGAEGSFMDFNFACKTKIPLTSLKHPIAPFALDGHKFPVITQTTIPVSLITSGNHTEISFLITDSPQTPIVLGHTWLHKHNPRIDWRLGSVILISCCCITWIIVSRRRVGFVFVLSSPCECLVCSWFYPLAIITLITDFTIQHSSHHRRPSFTIANILDSVIHSVVSLYLPSLLIKLC